ncbi:MAG: methyltransferase domain-containing protein [Deltaproteobacteria bacterium]|nr:methyltransferase domain-containing protein [Deltaproteobacteria bacterium]
MSDDRVHAGELRDPTASLRPPVGKLPARVAAVACIGGLGAATWLHAAGPPGPGGVPSSMAFLASLALCVLATTVTVSLRWARWHFLVRHYTVQLATRDSVAVYLATLPALVTPLCVGELLRVPLIRKRFRTPAAYLARIWLAERALDVGVLLGALLAVASPPGGGVFGLVFTAVVLAFARREHGRRGASAAPWVAAFALAITAAAWSLPIVAFALTLRMMEAPIECGAAVRAFVHGTLLGGAGGFPLDGLLAGAAMPAALARAGVPADAGMPALAVYRAGTAWFVVLLGLASIVAFRRRLIRLARGEAGAHFDEIAAEYEEEIPVHVRARLLGKKVDVMDDTLASRGVARGAHGLDLGCGQGWYLTEMCARGYTVDGTDYSTGQLAKVRSQVDEETRRRILLVRADAQALPFADASYAFVYGINAIHHLLSEDAQRRALREIVRVLRPGGVFLLHEINTINPLFRGYMGYLFPLLKKIDEGHERWVVPDALPAVAGARWTSEVRYFTFLPDFVPAPLLRVLATLEGTLERSRFRRFSAHYQACLVKDGAAGATPPPPERRGSET